MSRPKSIGELAQQQPQVVDNPSHRFIVNRYANGQNQVVDGVTIRTRKDKPGRFVGTGQSNGEMVNVPDHEEVNIEPM